MVKFDIIFEIYCELEVDMGMDNTESKRDKFVRLAEKRTNRILDTLQLLGNCSNTSVYEYTQKDVDKIFKAIQSQVDETKRRFNKQDNSKNNTFKLD